MTFWTKTKKKLLVMGGAGLAALQNVSATSYIPNITDLSDTFDDVGTILGDIVDLLPSLIELLVAFAFASMIVAIAYAIAGFLTGSLDIRNVGGMFRKKK